MSRLSIGPALLLAVCASHAQNIESKPKTVSSVEIFGSQAAIPFETRTGEVLDNLKLQHDVKALWASGRFSDIRVESVPDGDAVRVVFRVQAKPSFRVRKIEVTPPTPGIQLQLQPNSPIDPQDAQQIASSVRGQLQSSGFSLAKVNAILRPAGTGRADLQVKIDRGPFTKIQGVNLTGDLGGEAKGARKALHSTSTKTIVPGIPGIWNGWRSSPGYSHAAIQNDLLSLRSFYYARGYFDVDVKADDADIRAASLDPTGGKASLTYMIQAGPRYAVRQLNLLGSDGPRQIQPQSDAAFPVREICKALLQERRKSEQAGVLDFTANIEVREVTDVPGAENLEGRKWADLTATMQRGTAYRIGRIDFRGNRRFSDTTVRRAMILNEDDLLDQMLLRKSIARLNAMGFFEPLSESDVAINTPPGSNRADMLIRLKEKKMRSWSLSGPVGPLSLSGPLQFAIGSRLPAWGQNVLELATYSASLNFMLFAKPLGQFLPGFPNKRTLAAVIIQRPLLPGQRFLSGFAIAPQLGWQGILTGYGMSQARDLLGGLFQSDRQYTPPLNVTISHAGPGSEDKPQGNLSCEAPKTKLDWTMQIGGLATKLFFSFYPL